MEATQVVRLPRVWFEDAHGRDLEIGKPIRWMTNLVAVEMTRQQVAEARDAADYDANELQWEPDEYLVRVARSAIAAHRRLVQTEANWDGIEAALAEAGFGAS